MCEPPLLSYNDFSNGKEWPKSMVAKAKLYDGCVYHGGRQTTYYLHNPKHTNDERR